MLNHVRGKNFGPYLVNFFLFWAAKTHLRIGDIKIKKNAFDKVLWFYNYFANPNSVVRN
jgi:hypothetical protein